MKGYEGINFPFSVRLSIPQLQTHITTSSKQYPQMSHWTTINNLSHSRLIFYKVVPQFDSVQLVNITTITRVYHTYNYSIHGVFVNQQTLNWGKHHLVAHSPISVGEIRHDQVRSWKWWFSVFLRSPERNPGSGEKPEKPPRWRPYQRVFMGFSIYGGTPNKRMVFVRENTIEKYWNGWFRGTPYLAKLVCNLVNSMLKWWMYNYIVNISSWGL